MTSPRFEGKTVLIAGAARGIGRATAEMVLAEGGNVVAVDLDTSTFGHRDARDARLVPVTADALDEAAVVAAAETARARFGRIDVLVNAVGGSTVIANPGASVDEMPYADWRQLVEFNLNAAFLFLHASIPVMKEQGGGKIVNVSSLAHRGRSEGSSAAYAAAKAGIVALTTRLALEVGPSGITVNAVAPSLTVTERMAEYWDDMSAEARAQALARVPLRRVATAEDSAKVICFLASSDADFVSGVTIDVAGGQ